MASNPGGGAGASFCLLREEEEEVEGRRWDTRRERGRMCRKRGRRR